MAIGAGSAGARADDGYRRAGPFADARGNRSGPRRGIALVIVDCQRGGPSTGMPTKHEQSDVLAALYGTHGDSPRIALAPAPPKRRFTTRCSHLTSQTGTNARSSS